jgi:methylated-DNA-[protein]-cysteine S-methyltransferase
MTTTKPKAYWTTMETPIGTILLVGDGERLQELHLPDRFDDDSVPTGSVRDRSALAEPVRQLGGYFAGELTSFDLALDPAGTPFQQKVWWALADIPYAETESYGEVAARIGNHKACRAVGLANSRNPIAIVLPCHRVIGADGTLTGYGGGLDLKQRLLDMEAAVLARSR